MLQLPIEILKSLWSRLPDGRWAVSDIAGLKLKPKSGFDHDYFTFEDSFELLSTTPSRNLHEMLASFGSTNFLMQQSILPVVAWKDSDFFIRCIGTASIISCTGYLLTAAHVLMDPFDSGYGAIRDGSQLRLNDELHFGVFIPTSPAYGTRGIRFFPFEKYWLWGNWKESPLLNERDRFDYLTDVAVCKIAEMPHGAAHQPLGISLNAFAQGEAAYALGYAEMNDIPLERNAGSTAFDDFAMDIHVSIGDVMGIYPQNHLQKEVSTPGPCFDFRARIPGKMSGAPIFGAGGAVIRGVVSRSLSGERHAYGAMLGPATQLSLRDPSSNQRTLRTLMESGNEGIARIQGMGV